MFQNFPSSLTWDDYREYLNWQAKQWENEPKQPKVKKQGKKAQRKNRQ